MTEPNPFYLFISQNKKLREKQNKLFQEWMGNKYAPFGNEKAKAEYLTFLEETKLLFENSKKGVQTKLITDPGIELLTANVG